MTFSKKSRFLLLSGMQSSRFYRKCQNDSKSRYVTNVTIRSKNISLLLLSFMTFFFSLVRNGPKWTENLHGLEKYRRYFQGSGRVGPVRFGNLLA